MKVLLDSDICIYMINNNPPGIRRHLGAFQPGEVGLSAITVAELRYGAAKSRSRTRNSTALDLFLLTLEIAEFDDAAAAAYGEIRSFLEKRGVPLGPLDMLIAAHALSLGTDLITNNIREFKRVPGLKVLKWS